MFVEAGHLYAGARIICLNQHPVRGRFCDSEFKHQEIPYCCACGGTEAGNKVMNKNSCNKRKETASDRVFIVGGSCAGALMASVAGSWLAALVAVCIWAVIWHFFDKHFGFNQR